MGKSKSLVPATPPNPDDGAELQSHNVGHFGFSAMPLDNLGASEYTLVGIAVDTSGSISGFDKAMEEAIKNVIEACRKSPRADNLLMRVIKFDNNIHEIHGFKLLNDINKNDYDGTIAPGGSTALFDGAISAIESVTNYGKQLLDGGYAVNGLVVIITDGCENASTQQGPNGSTDPHFVKKAIQAAVKGEKLESLNTILIGVNVTDSYVKTGLDKFKNDAGITQYVNLTDASDKTLAKLAQFVAASISSTSQALGTGAPSKSLTI